MPVVDGVRGGQHQPGHPIRYPDPARPPVLARGSGWAPVVRAPARPGRGPDRRRCHPRRRAPDQGFCGGPAVDLDHVAGLIHRRLRASRSPSGSPPARSLPAPPSSTTQNFEPRRLPVTGPWSGPTWNSSCTPATGNWKPAPAAASAAWPARPRFTRPPSASASPSCSTEPPLSQGASERLDHLFGIPSTDSRRSTPGRDRKAAEG